MPQGRTRRPRRPKRIIDERRRELDWILDYHDDVVADLRVVAGIAEWSTLSSAEFFALVERLPYYAHTITHLRALEAREAAERAAEDASVLAALEADGLVERK